MQVIHPRDLADTLAGYVPLAAALEVGRWCNERALRDGIAFLIWSLV